jgi:hypothetical protein
MTKKPSRVRVLMMPYHDDGGKDPVGYSGLLIPVLNQPVNIKKRYRQQLS